MTEELAEWDPPSQVARPAAPWNVDELPKLNRAAQRLTQRLRRVHSSESLQALIHGFQTETGLALAPEGPVVADRPSGLKRVGLTAQWLCPELGTRLGLGLETALAHRVIDRVLGYDRTAAQQHLPTTPVEWGFWTVLAAKLTEGVNNAGQLPRLLLDRVGPDPFDPLGLGTCFTVAWELLHREQPVGVVRLWLPASLVHAETSHVSKPIAEKDFQRVAPVMDQVAAKGRVQAGTIAFSGGLGCLRPKLVIPWPDAPLGGTAPNLEGPVICRLGEGPGRWSFAGQIQPNSRGQRIEILQKPKPAPTTLNRGLLMSATADPSADLPVTLTVELGRLSLSLTKLADLKAGDVLELLRNSREPVDLTSGDRLVARGEIVQMDQDLGIRILQVLI